MPKVSIITINFNNLEGLQRTVESVVNQTWQEFEYIVIDGGSTDGSKEYLECQKDRIDYWVSEKDSGIYNAMNKGIAIATGEYLLFLNSGDNLINDFVLEKNNHYLSIKDIIYFGLQFKDEVRSLDCFYPKKLSFSFFIHDTLPHPATFIRKSIFEKVSGLYDENLKIVSDWKFFIESICRYNVSYMGVDVILSTFYEDGISSDCRNKDLIEFERVQVLKNNFGSYYSDIKELKGLREVMAKLQKSKKIKWMVKLGFINKF